MSSYKFLGVRQGCQIQPGCHVLIVGSLSDVVMCCNSMIITQYFVSATTHRPFMTCVLWPMKIFIATSIPDTKRKVGYVLIFVNGTLIH